MPASFSTHFRIASAACMLPLLLAVVALAPGAFGLVWAVAAPVFLTFPIWLIPAATALGAPTRYGDGAPPLPNQPALTLHSVPRPPPLHTFLALQ